MSETRLGGRVGCSRLSGERRRVAVLLLAWLLPSTSLNSLVNHGGPDSFALPAMSVCF